MKGERGRMKERLRERERERERERYHSLISFTQVKDRFCTLLSQQVSQLQNRLASMEFQDGGELASETSTGAPQQEVGDKLTHTHTHTHRATSCTVEW